MRTPAIILVAAIVMAAPTSAGARGTAPNATREGIVYRYYPGSGYRFQPLLSFANLNAAVSRHDAAAARRLALQLVGRSVRRGDALYWTYDFAYGGSGPGWTSGFTQAVAAEALARTAALTGDRSYMVAADAAFRALRRTLLMPLGGGVWIREYGFTNEAILNSQLESIMAIESYARVAGTPAARRVARDLEVAARTLLPRFDLGCWGRYELGGGAADVHYETYHVDLLRRLAARHQEPIWRDTYRRWKRCLR